MILVYILFPGGRIDPGSTLIENLSREVQEETSLTLNEEPKLIAAQDILRVPGRHVVRLTYIGNTEGEPKLNDENEEYKWFTLEELHTHDDLDMYFKELIKSNMIQ